MRISDWSSDVCSSGLLGPVDGEGGNVVSGFDPEERHGREVLSLAPCHHFPTPSPRPPSRGPAAFDGALGKSWTADQVRGDEIRPDPCPASGRNGAPSPASLRPNPADCFY